MVAGLQIGDHHDLSPDERVYGVVLGNAGDDLALLIAQTDLQTQQAIRACHAVRGFNFCHAQIEFLKFRKRNQVFSRFCFCHIDLLDTREYRIAGGDLAIGVQTSPWFQIVQMNILGRSRRAELLPNLPRF